MHRPDRISAEQRERDLAILNNSSVGDLVAATIGSGDASLNGTFVHYNLPPPGSAATAQDHAQNQDGAQHVEPRPSERPPFGETSLTGKKEVEPQSSSSSSQQQIDLSSPLASSTLADFLLKSTQVSTSRSPLVENPVPLLAGQMSEMLLTAKSQPETNATSAPSPAAASKNLPLAA